MWDLLRRYMEAVTRRQRQRAAALADAIAAGLDDDVARWIAISYLDGAEAGALAHARWLGLGEEFVQRPPPRYVRELQAAGLTLGTAFTEFAFAYLETEPTRNALEQYARAQVRQAQWTGQDDGSEATAGFASAETKVWVRAWARTDHRDWHDDMEGTAIQAEELFVLPGGPNAGAEVQRPRDWNRVRDPREWMNCGHALRWETAQTIDRNAGRVVFQPPTPAPSRPR